MQQLNAPRDVAAVSVGVAATKLISNTVEAFGPRRAISIQPEGTVYVGGPNVTAATGIKLVADQIWEIPFQTGQGWYAIASAGTVNVRVLPVY